MFILFINLLAARDPRPQAITTKLVSLTLKRLTRLTYKFINVFRIFVVVVSVRVEPQLGSAVHGGAEGRNGGDGQHVVADVGGLDFGEGLVTAEGVTARVRADAEFCK